MKEGLLVAGSGLTTKTYRKEAHPHVARRFGSQSQSS
jgi:hypothetical protein